MSGPEPRGDGGWTAQTGVVVGTLAGVALAVIGIRFLVSPQSAARFFGVSARPEAFELHSVVGLRDLWLGLLALAFAALREYRALALWLGLGALVCLGDAMIVAASTARPAALAFHLASGVVCAATAFACWRAHGRSLPK